MSRLSINVTTSTTTGEFGFGDTALLPVLALLSTAVREDLDKSALEGASDFVTGLD